MKNTFTLLTLKKWNRHLVRMTVITMSLLLMSISAFTQISALNVSRCGEGEVTLTATTELTGGTLTWYDVPFFGTPVATGTVFNTPVLQESTTYYVDYVINGVGVCDRKPVKVTINNTTVTANIYYSSVTYCNSLNQIQEATNSGSANGVYSVTPSSPLVVNASSGTFNPFGVTPGDYTITYTIPAEQQPAGCSEAPINTTITIVAALTTPVIASFTSPLCNSGAAPFNLTLSSGPSGGTWSASPNGLNITAAGLVTPAGSSPGNYTITYTKAGTGGCIPQYANASLTITGLPTASISYSGSPFCKDITNATPSLTGTGAYSNGTYSYTGSGLNSFSAETGAFNPSASTVGNYTIKYTAPVSAGCAAVEVTTPVTINALPTASITGGTTVCLNATEPKITFTGVTGTAPFTFTYKVNNGADRFVVTSSGNTVDVSQATVSAGTFMYTLYSVSDANGCSQAVSGTPTQTITITGAPVASFQYPQSLYCTTGTATPTYINGGVAGVFTSTPAGLSIASGTGVIDVAASASGAYTVTNTVGGCGTGVVATTEVTISHVNPTINGGDDATCGSTTLTANSDAANATYIWYNGAEVIPNETAKTLVVNATGDYKVQVTNTDNGCAETSDSKTVTINPLPVCSISGSKTVTYGTTNDYTAPAGMSSYVWSIDGDGTISGADNGQTVSIKTSAAGVYTLSVIINNGSCTSTCDQTVYVDKADAVISVTPYSVVYDGNSHTSAFTAVGVESSPVDLTSLMTVSGTTHTDTGTYTEDAWSFAGNTNYKSASGTVDNAITKATPTVSITGGSFTYAMSTSHGATGVTYGIGGVEDVLSPALTFSYVNSGGAEYGPTSTAPTDPGVYTATGSFAGNTNYTSASNTATITIYPTAPTGPASKTFCSGATVAQLTDVVTGITGTLKVYDAATNGNIVTGDAALSSANYYVSQTVNSVESARLTVAVTVSPLPTITTTGNVAVCYSAGEQTTSLAYTATTNSPTLYSIDWDVLADQANTSFAFVEGGGTLTGIVIPAGTAAGVWTGTMTITNANGCTSTQPIQVMVWATSVGGTATAVPSNVCTGNGTIITLTGHSISASSTIQWQKKTTGEFADISGETGATLTTGNLTATTIYRAVVTNGVCSSANSTETTVSVYSGQTTAPVITSPIFNGATSVSGTSSEADGTTIEVFKGAVSLGTTTVSSGIWSKTVSALAINDVITAKATATGECTSDVSAGVTVTAPPAVGDTYGGGKVAYIFQSGDPGYVAGETHGLIAAASDNAVSYWGCNNVDLISGADGTAIGTGNQNTTDIIAGCSNAGIAARLCSDLESSGMSDWYLPSKDELYKLYQNRVAIGGFSNALYWSSTEESAYNAYTYSFSDGTYPAKAKVDVQNLSRAIRSF